MEGIQHTSMGMTRQMYHYQNGPSAGEINILVDLFAKRKLIDMESNARAMLALWPNSGVCWKALGVALQMQEKDAIHALQKAATHLPQDSEVHANLGLEYRKKGNQAKARDAFKRALRLNPKLTTALLGLSIVLCDSEQAHQAIPYLDEITSVEPLNAEAFSQKGAALLAMGETIAAAETLKYALEINPRLAAAQCNMGVVLKKLGQIQGAKECAQRAIDSDPNYAMAYNNLAVIMQEQGDVAGSVPLLQKAIDRKLNFAEAFCNLANAQRDLGFAKDALANYEAAISLKPSLTQAWLNRGLVLQSVGRHRDALESCNKAFQLNPNDSMLQGSRLFMLAHQPEADWKSMRPAYAKYRALVEAPQQPHWPRHCNDKNPERKIKLGLISGDLRMHPVTNFIEPLLHLAKASAGLKLYAYSNHPFEDAVTQSIKPHFTTWRKVDSVGDNELAQSIVQDGIDILVDLSGHSSWNRLPVFARKPAPIQITWIGFPGSTGLQAMDYHISDKHFLPPGQFDDQFTEKIIYLPAAVTFLPSTQAPDVNPLPSLSQGHVTFGSFNRPNKISQPVVALWAKVLRALPNTRMLLGAMAQPGQHNALQEWFAAEGIDPQRLEFHPTCALFDYLKLHQKVDLCLDTFPYNGGTTTFNAAWMGVPTLTLTGSIPAGRQGATIMSQMGLPGMIATSEADYVQKAQAWAGNLTELAQIRTSLRKRYHDSPIGHPDQLAKSLEQALRRMWQRWCEGLPPQSFEVNG